MSRSRGRRYEPPRHRAAALITTGVWALVAGALALIGRTELRDANPQLPQTQETLKEDVQWAKAQKS